DAEVLGSDGLDARGEQAVGLAEVLAAVGAAAAGSRAGLHGWGLREWLRVDTTSAWRPTGARGREEFRSLSKTLPDTSAQVYRDLPPTTGPAAVREYHGRRCPAGWAGDSKSTGSNADWRPPV